MNARCSRATAAIGLITWLSLSSCSSDCAPVNSGGVIVDVVGVTSCDGIAVSATDGSTQYGFESTLASETDGGVVCEYQGLVGHPGTFTVQIAVNGQNETSQSITLEALDACNVSAKRVTFDASAS